MGLLGAGLVATAAKATDFLEVRDVAGGAGIRTRRAFALHARQLAASEAITVRDAAGRLCAIGGIYQDADGCEAWLAVGEGLSAALRPVLRILGVALKVVEAQAPGLTVTAYIHPASVAGDRLAAWLGFTLDGVTQTALGPLNTWRRRFS